MITNKQAINETLRLRSWSGLRLRWERIAAHLFHFLSQTERPHVGPHFFDVGQALCFGPDLSGIIPPERILLVFGPDRILLLMVDYNFVDGFVFIFRLVRHSYLLGCIVLFKLDQSQGLSLGTISTTCSSLKLLCLLPQMRDITEVFPNPFIRIDRVEIALATVSQDGNAVGVARNVSLHLFDRHQDGP